MCFAEERWFPRRESLQLLPAAHCVEKLSAYEISTMTVSLGMHKQGNLPQTFNDAQQTRKLRKVSRVVYHKGFNAKTKVSVFFCLAKIKIELCGTT